MPSDFCHEQCGLPNEEPGLCLVLDTNILLDVFVFGNPNGLRLWEIIRERKIKTCYGEDCLREFKAIIGQDRFAVPNERQSEILTEFTATAQMQPNPVDTPFKCRDREDQKFLAVAYASVPSVLLTKDKMLLKLNKRAKKLGFRIMKTEDYLGTLAREEQPSPIPET